MSPANSMTDMNLLNLQVTNAGETGKVLVPCGDNPYLNALGWRPVASAAPGMNLSGLYLLGSPNLPPHCSADRISSITL